MNPFFRALARPDDPYEILAELGVGYDSSMAMDVVREALDKTPVPV